MSTRQRHINRIATRDRLTVVMSRRATSGEVLIWSERAIPLVSR